MNIDNMMDVIDSRDIIERIEELEMFLEEDFNDTNSPLTFKEYLDVTHFEDDTLAAEYKSLLALQKQCEDYVDDWEYGATLIRESYFEEYMNDMIQDCYELPKDLPFWVNITYDYEALKQDCMEVDFDGVTYFVR